MKRFIYICEECNKVFAESYDGKGTSCSDCECWAKRAKVDKDGNLYIGDES